MEIKRFWFVLLMMLLMAAPFWNVAGAAPSAQQTDCLFFTQTTAGLRGFSVCDDEDAKFRTAFNSLGLARLGYPISRRYIRNGVVTQVFQKAIALM